MWPHTGCRVLSSFVSAKVSSVFFHPLRIAYVSNRVTLVLQLNSQIPDISKHELGYRARIVEIVEFHSLGRTSCFPTCLCSFKWRHRYTQSSKVPLVCTGAFLFACSLFCLRFFLSFSPFAWNPYCVGATIEKAIPPKALCTKELNCTKCMRKLSNCNWNRMIFLLLFWWQQAASNKANI